jgi:hypothetical protein
MGLPRHLAALSFLLSIAVPALPCTCVFAEGSHFAEAAMSAASVVFRGTVLQRKTLPQRVEMRSRGRYAITFRVNEYWKGSPDRTVILYGLDARADCLGDGGYEVGKSYLVYASEREAKDVVLGGYFWYGWTDVLAEGMKMLVPTACAPDGYNPDKKALRHDLGKGRIPPKTP